jgi:5-formyltetrahydrofolate cyclo-ligase
MRAMLGNQKETERLNKSREIAEKILETEAFQKAKTIMFYDATDKEVTARELIEKALNEGKQVLLPYVDQMVSEIRPSLVKNLEDDLRRGNYDIMEPKPEKRRQVELNEIDLVLVPGLAFDRKGNRLGRGKGYYDRFLKILPPKAKRYGLAFDFQILARIPINDFDVRVDSVITNE